MERISVAMVRPHLRDLPTHPLRPDYRIRTFRPGEADVWAEIEASVGEFPSVERALAHFEREFGAHEEEMATCCFFLEDAEGRPVGTTTAWHPNTTHPWPRAPAEGEGYGRLHWVAIRPEHQGKGLSKPLVGAAMARLAELYSRAYLTSQTTSWKAIKVYLDFGFEPLPTTPRWEEAWALLRQITRHPRLKEYATW
ncbi:MAG: GNAT family N-acetyltransferase [Armatimonadetes bacterium]|nr:GNAT family N-acetyltransferase [Armatimonadota bacterium]